MGNSLRRPQRGAVLYDEEVGRFHHSAQTSVSPCGVAQHIHRYRTATDTRTARIRIVVTDGQHTAAAFHQCRMARKGTRPAESIIQSIVHSDTFSLYTAGKAHAPAFGRIAEQNPVARHEKYGFGLFCQGEILALAKVPNIAVQTVPNHIGCSTHVT